MTKSVKIILTTILALIIFTLIVIFFYFGFSFLFFSIIENWVTTRLGLDFYLARLFSVIIVVGITAVCPILAWYLIVGKKKLFGALSLIGIQAGICLLVYTVGNNVCFDRKTGEPLCYFADTEKGRVWSRSPGFDPESGIPFKQYTQKVRETEKRRR